MQCSFNEKACLADTRSIDSIFGSVIVAVVFLTNIVLQLLAEWPEAKRYAVTSLFALFVSGILVIWAIGSLSEYWPSKIFAWGSAFLALFSELLIFAFFWYVYEYNVPYDPSLVPPIALFITGISFWFSGWFVKYVVVKAYCGSLHPEEGKGSQIRAWGRGWFIATTLFGALAIVVALALLN